MTPSAKIRIGHKPLNTPHAVQVDTAPDGTPRAVIEAGEPRPITAIREQWRIDDEWWRPHAIARTYWEVVIEDGALLVLFQDLTDGAWYQQRGTGTAADEPGAAKQTA